MHALLEGYLAGVHAEDRDLRGLDREERQYLAALAGL